MKVSEILDAVNDTQGTNAKLAILQANSDNRLLQQVLCYSLNPFLKFNVKKVPKTVGRHPVAIANEVNENWSWPTFLQACDKCAMRVVTGNAAVTLFEDVFRNVSKQDEFWMRKVLEKKCPNGISTSSVNKVFTNLIPIFEVQLAEKWSKKTANRLPARVRIEPKLDGIRFLCIVTDGTCTAFARSGKQIKNFDDTICVEMAKLPAGVYDGEVMSENFTALMRQVHRKYGVDVSEAYLTVFDYISLADWDANKSTETFAERRAKLEKIFAENKLVGVELIEQREIDNDLNQVIACQKEWEALGFEGAMVKNPNAPYAFGRSDSVLKVKSFFDIDLPVIGFKEGVGRHVGSLGSILVDNSGVEVNVGSGFSDEQRVEIWNNQDRYLGLIAELRAQETTEDGSLRFPTFVCWRVDKN